MPTPKGIDVGTYRTTEGTTHRHIMLRDDLYEIVRTKARKESRTIRSVIEGCIYHHLECQNMPVPDPDDPILRDKTSKRKNREMTEVVGYDKK